MLAEHATALTKEAFQLMKDYKEASGGELEASGSELFQ
jgi:hypothetical protein